MKTIFSFCAILFASIAINSNAGDTLSLDEMKKNFYTPHKQDFSTCDQMKRHEEDSKAGSLSPSPIAYLNFLTKAERTKLYPIWAIRTTDVVVNDKRRITSSKQRLLLHHFGCLKKGADSSALYKRFKDKYGTKGQEQLFATWYTGKLTHVSDLYPYGATSVSMWKSNYDVVKGEIVKKKFHNPRGYCMELSQEIRFGGSWIIDISPEMRLFADTINKQWRKANYDKRIKSNVSLTLLLHYDQKGTPSLSVLSRKKISTDEAESIKLLQNAIRELSKERKPIDGLFTADGRFLNGRYLRAAYSTEKGWSINDYFLQTPKDNKSNSKKQVKEPTLLKSLRRYA
ncbi:MAG: DUF5030 domain-containing protein [Bacteroides sp.]